MPVAPSFSTMPIVRDAYIKNDKYYVDVRNPKTGTVRSVRWYSDKEYAKNYGSKITDDKRDEYGGFKHARGFDNGPIIVIRNNKPTDEEWLGRSIARYAVGIGWYFVSTDTLPEDIPTHFKFLSLSWNEFRGVDDNHSKDPKVLSEILAEKAKRGGWLPL